MTFCIKHYSEMVLYVFLDNTRKNVKCPILILGFVLISFPNGGAMPAALCINIRLALG